VGLTELGAAYHIVSSAKEHAAPADKVFLASHQKLLGNLIAEIESRPTPQPPTTKPIAAVRGWFHGECVIHPLDPSLALPAGMALYAAPQPVVPDVRVLSRDEARLALWRAIQEVVAGNPTDDKLILENLYRSGVWLCLLSAGKGGE
jgi:hypothetical protein